MLIILSRRNSDDVSSVHKKTAHLGAVHLIANQSTSEPDNRFQHSLEGFQLVVAELTEDFFLLFSGYCP